jgi:hypothetical protein
MPHDELDSLLAEQVAYYRARADEEDETGVIGTEQDGRRLRAAAEALRAARAGARARLRNRPMDRSARGQRTESDRGRRITGGPCDQSAQGRQPARALRRGKPVRLAPRRAYDTVFFAFWLSDVPPEDFEAFWALFAECPPWAGLLHRGPPGHGHPRAYPARSARLRRRPRAAGRTDLPGGQSLPRAPMAPYATFALSWEVDIETIGPHFFYATARRQPQSRSASSDGCRAVSP